jgi:vacuolar protein sorting-associated protein IST1
LIYRIRQLKRERQGYSKVKNRELAKLLKEGREDLARIKTEDVITNDNVVVALDIIELHCEQLHVRAHMLDHLAFGQKRPAARKRPNVERKANSAGGGAGAHGGGSWASGFWRALGFTEPREEGLQPSETAKEQTVDHGEIEQHASVEEVEVCIDSELDAAAAVIFYAYPRIPRDIPGLPELRAKLVLRWGTDFATKAQENIASSKVPEELIERLRIRKPPETLVEAYLREIARSHGIPWHQDEVEEPPENTETEPHASPAQDKTDLHPFEERETTKPTQSQSFDDVRDSSESVLPPRPRHDDQSSQTNGPEIDSGTAGDTAPSKGTVIPEVDELARRFAALKR